MGKKVTAWKTKGMNRDLSVSAFNPEFTFENVNLRLSTNENNTMMSWVNEKGPAAINIIQDGTEDIALVLQGTPIGTAVLNHQLIIFTTSSNQEPDYIYLLWYSDTSKTSMKGKKLFSGHLNFSVEHPLETLVYYEAEHIQKVYWTDGVNQPRLINIANAEQLAKWDATTQVEDFFFDFVPSYAMTDSATVEKNNSSSGLFAPGVIQYCYTYVNKYGQQSNIIWCSTLYYLSHSERGASPEDKVTNSFTITINSADTNFDYVRLYAIQRTSLNLDAFVRRVVDIPITGGQLIYTDNGTTGNTVDPYELLYIGGKEITAYTMADKDNTLFMGNITQPNFSVTKIQEYFDTQRSYYEGNNGIVYSNTDTAKQIVLDHSYSIYTNTNMLNKSLREISTFKGGEKYRFGFQLQKRTGEWSEPIFLGDKENELYPRTNVYSDTINLVDASASINFAAIDTYLKNHGETKGFDYSIYKRIRPVIVYPNIADRQVLCQGVLNPTVFNVMDRCDNSPFAQSSWFFRPFMASTEMPVVYEDTSEYTEITTFAYDPDAPIEPIPFTGFEYPTTKKYVMIVQFTDPTKIDTILTRGSLKMKQERTSQYGASSSRTRITYIYYDFGAIDLGSDNKYALFRNDEWQREGSSTEGSTTTSWEWDEGVVKVALDDTAANKPLISYLYTGLQHNENTKNLYYYVQEDGSSMTDVSFWFHDNVTGYVVKLSSIDQMAQDYNINTSNISGDWLRYKHYDSIYSSQEAQQDTDLTRMVEIQGSVGTNISPIYKYVQGNIGDPNRTGAARRGGRIGVDIESPSNTQFYVDQSIVTFHSPDLDFDTDVQTYGTDNLKLKIIGAVPITASVSAHSITTSSAMLETLHNNSTDSSLFQYGSGENNSTVIHENVDIFGGKRLVADFLWNDVFVQKKTDKDLDANDQVETKGAIYDFPVYPWHRSGSLNNDMRPAEYASSLLKTKKESTMLYSINTEYFHEHGNLSNINLDAVECQIHLQENDYVHNMRLPRQKETSSEINYYPNIDKVLYNKDGYRIFTLTDSEGENSSDSTAEERTRQRAGGRVISKSSDTQEKVTSPILMKYKSGTHAVLALGLNDNNDIKLLPYGIWGNIHVGQYENPVDDSNAYESFWGDTKMTFYHTGVNMSNLFKHNNTPIAHNFLWIGELYKEPINQFGGNTLDALMHNNWLVAGPTMNIDGVSSITLKWTDGDTYYQRYDCLKTYAFTPEDTNQLVEILSFMCETHVNIDGRYDRNRGQVDNTNMSPVNFNLLNPVYSQKDNFFTSKKVEDGGLTEHVYPNQYYYSQTKIPGADVDEYTHVTLASTDYLDGDKGSINAIRRLNNQLIAFQDTGISQILYNENVQISSTEGVPIEIANSGKVQGKRYFSDTIGCSNKWAIATAPTGLYFMDSKDKSIYLFNGQLQNLSLQGGFNVWSKQNIPSSDFKWNPVDYDNFTAYYDKLNQDILFTNKNTSLAFSERMNAFTSFYDYGSTPYFNNLDDTGVWVRADGSLWKHNAGEYCNFFGVNKPFSMTLVGNPEPTTDKIFTNLEFRATIDGEGTETDNKFTPTLPFDYLEAWDEYQHGKAILSHMTGHKSVLHHTSDGLAAIKRKFRMWACDIPRDNAPLASDAGMNIKRFKVRPMDRMRNPWVYLKLQKNAAESGSYQHRTEVHDMTMIYFS